MIEAIPQNEKLAFPVKKPSGSRFAAKLRYWWCWFVAGFLFLLIGTPVLPFLWLINRRMWVHPIGSWGAKVWLRACGASVKVTGLENIKDSRSYVFVSNHRSYLDTVALFFYSDRKMGLVAKKELLKFPIFGPGLGFVNIIAIDRSDPESARRSMEKAREVMKSGSSFGVFAEGTRAMPGELLPFKKGAFHLAFQTNSPVVPVAIKNTDRMMGKKTGLLFPGEIEMVLLPPIETSNLNAEDELMDLLVRTREAIAHELTRNESEKATK
jgi:1-acyl-sn-glycerol-3-phosphate acyltransferase